MNATSAAQTLHILTWNVNGLDDRRLGPRMEELCLEILVGGNLGAALAGERRARVPDVILLQEVVRAAYYGQLRPHLQAAGFVVRPDPPPDSRGYYELVAARPPWSVADCRWRPFTESPLGRGCLEATLRRTDPGQTVRVMTAHMESLSSGRDCRLAQTRQIVMWMREGGVPCVFAGDTNLREREWRSLQNGFAALDAFELAGSPEDARHTWWPADRSRRYRFDRVWLDPDAGWRVGGFRLRSRPEASDHSGVEALLELDAPA